MLPLDYLLNAMRDGAFKRKEWLLSIFSLIHEQPDDYLKNPFPYRLVRRDSGYSFVDPLLNNNLSSISGAEPEAPLFRFKDRVSLKAGDVPNLTRDVETSIGNVIVNYIALVYSTNDKIEFMAGKITPNMLEQPFEKRLVGDNEITESEKGDNAITVSEYKKFIEGVYFLLSLSNIAVPSASPKTLTRDPRIPQLKKQLLEENKDRLHDPATIARIDKQLEMVDREWVDDWGKDFLIKDKAFANARKKMFTMVGYEKAFIDGEKPTLVTESLADNAILKIENIPAMYNSSREGSLNRGYMTQLGGVAVKEAIRAMQNTKIVLGDCGSTLGIPVTITPKTQKELIGFYYIKGDKVVEITEDSNLPMGSDILLRSPMLCKSPYTDFCSVCMGKKNSESPTGLSALVANIGSSFMMVFMKKMHVTSLALARYDHLTYIS